MKILQLGKFYPIRGGVEKVMWDLTRGLSGRGVDCDMLCAMLPGDGFDEADAPLVEDGPQERGVRAVIRFNDHGRVICVKSMAKVAATMLSPSMVFWLRRHAREYDIIHVHHPDPMACLALWLSGYKGRVILHWHSDILKQKGLLTLYRPLQKWLVRRAEKIVGTTPVYVAQSPDLQSAQHKVTYLPIGIEDNIRIVSVSMSSDGDCTPDDASLRSAPPQAVPPLSLPRVARSAGGQSPSPDRETTIFSLGRLVEYKGFKYLIEAAALLPENYHVLIAGKGPLKEELQSQIDAVAPGRVELLGFVSDARARELYNACDVFVLSSVMKTEAFGIVQLEAMSCGKPVIATHIPGSGTDWVNEDGVSGKNVPSCDAKALAEAIMEVCGEGYEDFSQGARARYEKLFTFDRMVEGALKIYEN